MEKNIDKYFEILELDKSATLTEVTSSYRFLKKLYSKGKNPSFGHALEDFSEKRKEEILADIENAYIKLKDFFLINKGDEKKAVPKFNEKVKFSGKMLRDIRIEMLIAIDEICANTNIRKTYIEAIENEDFNALPPLVYTRGFIKAYAEFLGLPVERVLSDFMEKSKSSDL